jgi:hypothetical protein
VEVASLALRVTPAAVGVWLVRRAVGLLRELVGV